MLLYEVWPPPTITLCDKSLRRPPKKKRKKMAYEYTMLASECAPSINLGRPERLSQRPFSPFSPKRFNKSIYIPPFKHGFAEKKMPYLKSRNNTLFYYNVTSIIHSKPIDFGHKYILPQTDDHKYHFYLWREKHFRPIDDEKKNKITYLYIVV